MPAADLLISALRERGINFKKEDIERELQNESQQGTGNAQWVMEHVSPHTLLSKDEAALINVLERSGALETFLRQPELASIRPLADDEIRAATATLKSSTATCANQVATLKAQLGLARTLQMNRQETDQDHDRYVTALKRKHLLEKQRTKAMVQLASSLNRTNDMRKNTGKKQLLQSVSSRLMNDDDILFKIEELAAELELTEMDEQTEKRTPELISTLSKLTSEEIRCRLDRVYLETLLTGADAPADVPDNRDACIALQEDLESLYSEIDVLAEMSARHEFGQPILDELQKKKQSSASSLEDNFDVMLDLLSEMTRSTKQNVDRVLYYQSHREALDQLSALFRKEITSKQAMETQSKKSHRRESSISSIKVQTSKPTQSQPEAQALESFLRRLGISTALHGEESLADIISEKRSEMARIVCHNSIGMSAEMPLLASLGSTDEAKELLTCTLHANDSSYASEPSLADPVQQGNLANLEKELMVIQKEIERVDLGMLAEPDRFRDKFIEKWRQP
ncbi:hypothetical protein UA08_04397 [Talaromyces atroroseus]|uniref:HAUS augmin-like complex subunit 3 N-terminal domain-containing protein n=1 Tax=Talaromyces atroroseus TaxID=1441469 RepID=A0A1Q5Q9R1_TALAT|nr:hypothetical protein UA08_04397 [Talaromyces atroroseus]OKL60749.1 hypothetical protein UA08_04397 [Talaromyces atroroseus]